MNIHEHAKNSLTKSQLMVKLGIPSNGGGFKRLNRLIEKENVDISHFERIAWNRVYPKVEKSCPVCGKLFIIHEGSPRANTVCSRSCSNTMFRSDENHPSWTIGKGSYRERCWRTWGKKCAIPGCEWELTVDAHHIDGDRNNNVKTNLISLCPNHHSLLRLEDENREMMNELIKKLVEEKFSIPVTQGGDTFS